MYIPEKFREKISALIKDCKEDTCLEWQGPLLKGYPAFNTSFEGKKYHGLIHRIAYQIFYNDDLTSDNIICHKCDNPKCFNPLHLFKGTHADNVADKVRKGRQAKGERNGRWIDGRTLRPRIPKPHTYGRKLTPEQVHEIKELRKQKVTIEKISKMLNVSLSTIKDISCGRAYATFE